MKLFQKLLVVPAALGLVAPLAANAAEVNMTDVSKYASKPSKSIKAPSSAQFSDIVPGDWAYTTLKNLSDSYGCVDNTYTQNLNSGLALTRYEAAALVNACLDNGVVASADSSEASLLADEFGVEMAILKGRVDGLEYKLNELNAGTFSSTTKLNGQAFFVLGGAHWQKGTSQTERYHSQYSYELDFKTSFTGQDLLHAAFEAGDYDVAAAVTEPLLLDNTSLTNSNALTLQNLYYSFPLGEFKVAAGPLYDLTEISPTTTSTYSNSFFLGGFFLGPNAFGQAEGVNGPGVGFSYLFDNGFNLGGGFVAINGADADLGIATNEGVDAVSLSFGYDSPGFGGGITYTSLEDPDGAISELIFDLTGLDFNEDPHAIGIGAYWAPNERFDISAGIDFLDAGIDGYEDGATVSVGADWVVGKGVLSIGAATVPDWDADNDYDIAGGAYEVYYDLPINDGISIKPGLMIADIDYDAGESSTRYAIETTFKF